MMLRAFHRSRRERAIRLPFLSTRRLRCASTAALLAHRIPPGQQLLPSRLDQLIEMQLHVVQEERPDRSACFVFGGSESEEIGLQMSARDRISLAPAHEQE